MSRLLNLVGFPVHPFGLGRSWSEQRRIKQKRQAKAELARVTEQRPSPLHLVAPISSSLSTPTPQPFSTFLTRLPLEIRRKVYEYVLGNRVIYLMHISKRIAHQSRPLPAHHFTMQDDDGDDEGTKKKEVYMPDAAPEVHWHDLEALIPSPHQLSTLPLSLLQTCRTIYAEALPVLYNANIFVCTSPLALIYLHDLPLVPPAQLHLIRHLRLEWRYFTDPEAMHGCVHAPYDDATWLRFWDIVADMPQLLTLGVMLEVWAQEDEMSVDAEWVEVMKRVKGLRAAEARIEWRLLWEGVRQPAIEEAVEMAWMG